MSASLDEHVARLRAIWGDDDGQVRWHLYAAVYRDVRWESDEPDADARHVEAHHAALTAIWDAALVAREPVAPELPRMTGLSSGTCDELLSKGWTYTDELGSIPRWEHPIAQMREPVASDVIPKGQTA